MPDRVRHDESAIARLEPIAKRLNHRMSTLTYKDQSAAELRLHVLADRVDFQRFGPLATVRLEQPQLQVKASIIGTSHITHIAYDNTQHVCEILACTDIPPALQSTFSDWIVNLTRPIDLQLTPALHYHFAAQRTDSQRGQPAFRALAQHIVQASADTARSSSAGLDYSFPATLRGPAPQTLVWVMLDKTSRRVTVKTAHSYPNEDTIIFSDSCVTLT